MDENEELVAGLTAGIFEGMPAAEEAIKELVQTAIEAAQAERDKY